jgi:bacteriorhodopsin
VKAKFAVAASDEGEGSKLMWIVAAVVVVAVGVVVTLRRMTSAPS